MLEYFHGVLFLTSNRASRIDEAFQSRIDVHLNYPNLDAPSRKTVWKNFFLKSTKTVEVTDEELDRLAQIALNGRQIKSIVKQSQLIAGRNKDSTVKMDNIEDVLRIVKSCRGNLSGYSKVYDGPPEAKSSDPNTPAKKRWLRWPAWLADVALALY